MPSQPTNNQIEEAKAYILKRVQAETTMQSRLDRYLKEAAKRIIYISYKYNIPPKQFRFSANNQLQKEVDEVIAWLKSKLDQDAFGLATLNRQVEDDEIQNHFYREDHGKTFLERLNIYCNRWKYEIEVFVAASLALGLSKEKSLQAFSSHYENPYSNSIISKAGKLIGAVRSSEVHYGVGKSNKAYNMLKSLLIYKIAESWMYSYWLRRKRSGAIGFYSFRGSSYPCGICNSMAGFHPIGDAMPLYHNYCKCYMVFVFN